MLFFDEAIMGEDLGNSQIFVVVKKIMILRYLL